MSEIDARCPHGCDSTVYCKTCDNKYPDLVPTAPPEELEWAIQRIERSREIRLAWVAHLQAQENGEPCPQCPPGRYIESAVGGVEHHKAVAADYTRVLAVLRAAAPVPSGRAEAPWPAIQEWQEAHRHSIAAYRAWDAACNASGKPHAIEARFRLQDAMNRVQRAEEVLAALSPAGPPEPGGEREQAAQIADSFAENDGATDMERRIARQIAAAIRAAPSTGEGDSR